MIQIVLIAILSLLAQLVFPWWSLAVVTFLVCFWRGESGGRSFLYGFLGVGLVWLGYALLIQIRTNGILTGRIGELLFKVNDALLPIVITVFMGGLIGGLAGRAGFQLRLATDGLKSDG